MEIQNIFIYLFGVLMVFAALGVVVSKKTLTSALCLVSTMCLIAAQFAMMRADFIATLQILVYAGAIMILVVFVIMLLGVEKDAEVSAPSLFSGGLPSWVGICFSIIFLFLVVGMLNQGSPLISINIDSGNLVQPDSKQIGKLLLVDYLLPFYGVGILMLAAIVAAALLAFTTKRPLLPGRGLKAVRKKYENIPEIEGE